MYTSDLDRMKTMSDDARVRPNWALLADYLSLHGRGIRKPALDTLRSFTSDAANWPFEERLELTLWVLETLKLSTVPGPLFMMVVLPTCEEWRQREPGNARPHLWLGKLGQANTWDHFRRALELDAECDEARAMLCENMVGYVDFNQHHLPEGYINDPAEDLGVLAEAEKLWAGRANSETARQHLAEITFFRERAEDWLRKYPRQV